MNPESNQPDDALDRLLASAHWPTPSDDAAERLIAFWQAILQTGASSSQVSAAGEPLDELLEQAKWPEPGEQAVARLADSWRELVDADQQAAASAQAAAVPLRRFPGRWWIAAAASLLMMGGALLWRFVAWPVQPVAQRPTSDIAVQAPTDSGPEVVTESLVPPSREPNAFELSLVAVRRNHVRSAQAPTADRPRSRTSPSPQAPRMAARSLRAGKGGAKVMREQPAVRWLAGAISEARAANKLMKQLSGKRAEQALIERVQATRGPLQMAAVRVLAPIATRRSLPLLRQALALDDLKGDVVPALLRLEESASLARIVTSEEDSANRCRIMAALWQRDDIEAWQVAFRLARQPQLAGDAVIAFKAAEGAPVDWLCRMVIESPQMSDRMAAAKFLGQLDRPEVTQRLIALTEDAAGRQPALAGLLSSSEPTARAYLAAAESDPYWIASIRSVRHHEQFLTDLPGDNEHGTP